MQGGIVSRCLAALMLCAILGACMRDDSRAPSVVLLPFGEATAAVSTPVPAPGTPTPKNHALSSEDLNSAFEKLPPQIRNQLGQLKSAMDAWTAELAAKDRAFFDSAEKIYALCAQPWKESDRPIDLVTAWQTEVPAQTFVPPTVDCIYLRLQQISALRRYQVDTAGHFVLSGTNTIFYQREPSISIGRAAFDMHPLEFGRLPVSSYNISLTDLLQNPKMSAVRRSLGNDASEVRFYRARIQPIYKNGQLVDRLHVIVKEWRMPQDTADVRSWMVISEGAAAVVYESPVHRHERILRGPQMEMHRAAAFRALAYFRGGSVLALGPDELEAFNNYWTSANIWK